MMLAYYQITKKKERQTNNTPLKNLQIFFLSVKDLLKTNRFFLKKLTFNQSLFNPKTKGLLNFTALLAITSKNCIVCD